ncbi:Zinc transporter ZupT [Ureibacillus acetophenoni]
MPAAFGLFYPLPLRWQKVGKIPAWVPVAIGFLLGGMFLFSVDKLLPHLHPNTPMKRAEGILPKKRKRSTLLVLAITLHNIPEGLAIGVSFGAVAIGSPSASLAGALALAIGIGIQNIPEGVAVSMPLLRDGMSKRKSFMFGQFSGMVEPISAIIGFLAVAFIAPLLPFALAFAAGAMIFVVAEEVIPIMVAIVMVFREPLMDVFTDNPKVIEIGVSVLLLSILLETGRTMNITIINTLQCYCGNARFPVKIGFLSMICMSLPLWLFTCLRL